MDQAKLIKARKYYDLVHSGTPKADAARSVKIPVAVVEKSPEYMAIINAVAQLEREQLKHELEATKRKQLHSYSRLLDEGEKLMDEAESVEDRIRAQANQRDNLNVGVVSEAIAWNSEDRNSSDYGDVLDGVILE